MADLFNLGTSNNAPPPIPGGYGNPTGANVGIKSSSLTPGIPAFGTFGSVPNGSTTPAISAYNVPTFSGGDTGLTGLTTNLTNGIPSNLMGNLSRELTRAYGKGTGDLLLQFLQNGSFNPQVASAFLNSMQPAIARGQGDILNAFGNAGARYSSGASLGLGDYLSQVNLNENQTLASLYENSSNQQQALLENLLPTLHTEEANQGGGILSDILGGLEAVGGIVAAPFSGGASIPLIGAGISTITGGNKGGGSSGSSGADINKILQSLGIGQNNGSVSSIDLGNPTPIPSTLPTQIPMPDIGNTLSNPGSTLGGLDLNSILSGFGNNNGGDSIFSGLFQ